MSHHHHVRYTYSCLPLAQTKIYRPHAFGRVKQMWYEMMVKFKTTSLVVIAGGAGIGGGGGGGVNKLA